MKKSCSNVSTQKCELKPEMLKVKQRHLSQKIVNEPQSKNDASATSVHASAPSVHLQNVNENGINWGLNKVHQKAEICTKNDLKSANNDDKIDTSLHP